MGKHIVFMLAVVGAVLVSVWVLAGAGREKFRQGYYIDANNNRVEGFIYFNENNYDHFYFRLGTGGRAARIGVAVSNGFGFDNRNFVVLEDVHWQTSLWRNYARRAFAELLVDGRVKLYRVLSEANQLHPITGKAGAIQVVSNYLLRREGDYTYLALSEKRQPFRQQLSEYLKDNPAISEQILKSDSSVFDLTGVITAYNKGGQ
ncbi:hypothetical protein GA0116948_10427 [Chitinophaga costaii]|uniref:Uncharacterized protein n=1 Tax=Chitinophaga costaii TaxID=1335309 RepID=A0A1C4CA79_9BACT|nr:hypothetical protein [Chitinophaga costaii]PUZ27173.1 hypothetical protein DCM91_08100 [Chitinophaga costaii]SCC15942.1 hypothetical protein GA0116948_10427 [Chitinophaga costaii]